MSQQAFVAALLDPALPVPTGLTGPAGQASRRFAVYRNNVAVGLTEALRAGFPVVQKLVGEAFFTAMAGEFLRRHPPQGRIMMLYGADFPGFLSRFPPVSHLPYLPDVARLEQALRESYHAADVAPLPPDSLAAIPEATLLVSRLRLAPAVRLIRSPWPIHAIWHANLHGGPVAQGGQDVVILRPDFDPLPQVVPQTAADFLAALLAGAVLASALSAAGEALDLPAVLTLLLDGHALTGVSP